MVNLEFCDTHNMVAYLEKLEGSKGFHQIVDFLNASHIRYALTENPTIYVSLINQFWETATARRLDNEEIEIIATIDGKVKIATESSIRRHLKLAESIGISSLPTTDIFEHLSLMGNMKRASKGYTGEDIPWFPTMFVQGLIVQGEGSIVLVESHHTPTSAPSTSQPHFPPTLRILIRHETKVPQPSSPPHTNAADKVASTGMDNPTMPHDSPLLRVNTLESDEGSMTLQELMVFCTTLSKKVESLEKDLKQTKKIYGAAYTKLIKKGRKIAAINQDPTISLVQHDAQTQGRYRQDMDYDTSVFNTTTTGAKISTASPEVKTVGVFIDDTVAETLVYIKRSEEKVKDKAVREAGGTKRAAEEELGHQSSKKQKLGELSQDELQQLMIIVPEEGMDIEALQTKYPIIDWEVYTEDSRKDDLVKLWSLVQERLTSKKLTEDKEREIWVELKRLFESDADDELWKS
nr:hypothetical protein [Tanacetum cinerariifolium]